MKYAMISQPMRGKTKDEIRKTREYAETALVGMGYHVLDTYDAEYGDPPTGVNYPLYHLGKSLTTMAMCDAVFFFDEWQNARGCKIEHEAAKAYGLKIYYIRTPQRVTIKPVGGSEEEERVLFEAEHNGVAYKGYSDGGFFVKE